MKLVRDRIRAYMALTKRTVSIVGAVVVSAGMIAGAFALSGPLPFVSIIKKVDAASTAELLKAFAAKDSDTDGLSDWEESLYGTDPKNPQSVQSGLNDGEAVSQGLVKPKFVSEASVQNEQEDPEIPGGAPKKGSITEQFGQILFKNYLLGRGTQEPTQEQLLKFVDDAVAELTENNKPVLAYSISDVKTSSSGSEAMRTYIIDIENALLKHVTKAGSPELEYVTQAVMENDPSSLPKVTKIANDYLAQADDLMAISVPPEARLTHLAMANSLHQLGEATKSTGLIEEDPLRGILGLSFYQTAAVDALKSISGLSPLMDKAGVVFMEGEPGHAVQLRANIVSDMIESGTVPQI